MSDPREAVAQILRETRELPADQRLARLKDEVRAAIAERQLLMVEGITTQFGGDQATLDITFDDPRYDSSGGDYPWDEVGFAQGVIPGRSMGHPLLRRQVQLDRARHVARGLWAENEFAIGAHRLRQSYTVGRGVVWRMVPKERGIEDVYLTRAANAALEAFRTSNRLPLVERESVLRTDRDGETFLRLFANADGPLRVRFTEPEAVQQPVGFENDPRVQLGVETVFPEDSVDVEAYWINGERVPKISPDTDLLHVVHMKGGTDLNARRGWPIMWPARRNLIRAEKLLRNMGFVAALQAAIALIRKHESGTQTEIESFLDATKDLTVTNDVTGKSTRYQGIGPGTVIDTGPGYTYESPIHSLNAGNNVEVLRAELRAVAAMLNMPESMFTSQIDGSFAASLVAEGPFVKYMESEQDRFAWDLRAVVWTAIEHEVFWGRLPENVLHDYRLVGEFPSLEVRDFLRETQKRQIENTAGVLSVKTWRQKAGYDDEVEVKNFTIEPNPAAEEPDPVGGSDQAGNLSDPGSAADSTFAQDDAQSFLEDEVLMDGPVAALQRQFGHLLGKDPRAQMVLKLVGILTEPKLTAQEKVQAVLAELSAMEQEPAEQEPAGDAGGEVLPGTGV